MPGGQQESKRRMIRPARLGWPFCFFQVLRFSLVCFGVVLAASAPNAQPAPGATWDWQLTQPVDLSGHWQVVDLDPDNVTRAQVATLNRRGVFTICYVSIGTLEDWRDDVDEFPQSVIGNRYGDWPDERFLDVRRTDILVPLMTQRFQRCADLGFAAIEPDNSDVHSNDSGFPIRPGDMAGYLKELAGVAHGMGLAFGQKNAPDLTPDLSRFSDFAVAENCVQDGWCAALSGYIKSNRPVFDAEYGTTPASRRRICKATDGQRLSIIFKRQDLGVWRRGC